MGFEVPVSAMDRPPASGGRLVAAGVLVLAAVVALAIMTGGASSSERHVAAASVDPLESAPSANSGPAVSRAVPAALTCRDVDPETCRRMAKAAMLVLPDDTPEAIEATVWRSLLCNSTFDCPPSNLDGSTPLGSVIIRFADRGPRAAVNVVDRRTGPIQRAARAWVVRWMPELG